jgi:NADH:ubiquinone oxidoreductase subunit F (NADH-binding)
VRVIAAPCVGRCEQAPVAVVRPAPGAAGDGRAVQAAVARRVHDRHDRPAPIDLAAYRRRRAAMRCCKPAWPASARSTTVIQALEDSGLRGLGGAGFPAGRKWRIVRAEPRRG